MKKLHIIIALVLWGCAQIAEAQNMYRNYQSSTIIPQPQTAVSVVHSNGYVYYFQTDENGYLSVTEINPLSMNPTGNAKVFFPNLQNFIVYLNGGFEDTSGNFVLFGYQLQTHNIYMPQHPVYIIIAPNLSSCNVYYQNLLSGEFSAGCYGYNQNNDEVYILVNGSELVIVEAASPFNQHRFELSVVTNPNDHYSDVSWDNTHSRFIATGFAWNNNIGYKDPFVEVFEIINYDNINPTAEYCVLNQSYYDFNEYKSLHVQLDDNHLVLYQDLRRIDNPYAYDIIWLSRIQNFWDINMATINESWLYELPNTKLTAKDMIFDKCNKRLNFLGVFNYCSPLQILAQLNPYSLSSGIQIGQLGISFHALYSCPNPQPPYINLYASDISMFNLALNIHNPCYPLLIAGVGSKFGSILSETYDISLSSCDLLLWHIDKPANPIVKPYSIHFTTPDPNFDIIAFNSAPENNTVSYLCNEQNACSHQYGGKSLKLDTGAQEAVATIAIKDNQEFVCEGFDGEIQYYLYDIAGRLLVQGRTQNGIRNIVKKSNGIYLLQAFDSTGKRVVKKIVSL